MTLSTHVLHVEKNKVVPWRPTKFFLICLSHESVVNYYNTNFQLMQHHNYSLEELENMMPWEREIYIMLLSFLKEEQERQKQEQSENDNQRR